MKQPRSVKWAGLLSPIMKRLLIFVIYFGFVLSLFADQAVSVYKPNSNGTVARGCVSVVFLMTGVFSGTIGNATFSTTASTQTVLPINAVGDGKLLGAIPYTLAGAGTLIITEVR